MKIEDRNILDVEEGVICHGCNVIGAFGGLAGAIGRKWRVVADNYYELLKQVNYNWSLLGNIQNVIINDNLIVANLFSQFDIGEGRKTEYCAVVNCLIKVKKQHTGKKIYFPYQVFSGLGGANFNIILEMIETILRDEDVTICKI